MKTSHQILNMSPRDLRRLVARQQVRLEQHDYAWSGSGTFEERDECEACLAESKRVKRDVYNATKEPK